MIRAECLISFPLILFCQIITKRYSIMILSRHSRPSNLRTNLGFSPPVFHILLNQTLPIAMGIQNVCDDVHENDDINQCFSTLTQ